MKALLISANNEKDPYPVSPLGAAYVAQALKQNGHVVEILDLCFSEDHLGGTAAAVQRFSPDVVGLSIRNIDNLTCLKSVLYLPGVKRIVEAIKACTSVPIVAGGSGFSIFPEEVLRYLELDAGVVGAGEKAFSLFADALQNGGDVSGIPNLCYIADGAFHLNRLEYAEVNHHPDRSLLNNAAYLDLGGMANIQSKRGCPFACTYCTYPSIEGRTLRARDPREVVQELREMRSVYGIDHVFFVDDIFNFPEDHALGICEEIARNNVEVGWTCFATPKGMTRELAGLMKRAKCQGVEFGSDAGSEKTLAALGKQFTPDDIAYATRCCGEVGLPNAHYVIVGGPDEERSTVEDTFDLFDKIRPTAVIALTGVRIYPNTALHARAIEDGIVDKDRSLLEPVFYLSPSFDAASVARLVSEHAQRRHNWIVPGLGIRCDSEMLALLRKRGKKGPLWDMLA